LYIFNIYWLAKRKVTKREGHPAWRLPDIHARQVRELGPGFSTGLRQLLLRCSTSDIHVLACPDEKESTSLSIPLRACRPHLTAAQGPRLKAARILRACDDLDLACTP